MPFCDVSVIDKNASITVYQTRSQSIIKNSEGVRDENSFSSEFEKKQRRHNPNKIINHIFEKHNYSPERNKKQAY